MSRGTQKSGICFIAGLLALSILSCGREPTGVDRSGLLHSRGIAFNTVFPQGYTEYAHAAANQTSGNSVVFFDRVRVVLRNPDGSIAKDTIVEFPAGAEEVPLTISLLLPASAPASGLILSGSMDYMNGSTVVLASTAPFQVLAQPVTAGSTPPPPVTVTVPVTYVGPGSTAAGVVISPKASAVNTGASFTFTAQARDASGTVIPNTPIVFESADPNKATIQPATGAGTAGASRGTVTITARLLNGPSDAATLTINAPPAALVYVSGSPQQANVNAQVPQPVIVQVNATDGGTAAGVQVTFAAQNGGSVGAATVTTDADGRAQTTWRLGPTAGPQTMTAAVAGLTGSPVTFNATAIALPAARLEFVQQPSNGTAGTPVTPAITVRAVDVNGAAVPAFTGTVTLALAPGAPAGAVLSGTLTADAVAGIATFADVRLNTTGSYTLSASTPSLTSATSASFIITAGAANRLVFQNYPINGGPAGAAMDPITVSVKDAVGNAVTNFTGPVTLAIASGPVGAAITGVVTINAVAGVATFNGISLQTAGAYALGASGAGLVGATGPAFTITPGPASQLILVSGSAQGAPGSGTLASPIVVRAADAFGNGVLGVTVNFGPTGGSGTANPTSAVSDPAGIVQTIWTLGSTAGTHTLNVSAAGLTPNPLAVTATATTTTGVLRTWTGAVDAVFTTAGNWSPAGAPGGGDNIVIVATATAPVISAPVTVGSLSIATGVSLTNNSTLTISAGALDAGTTITGTGSVTLAGNGNWTGVVNQNVTVTGTYNVTGTATVKGNVSVTAGQLSIGAATLNVSGNFATSGTGKLMMNSPAAVLSVRTSVTFGGGVSVPSDGKILVYHDFTTTGAALQATGSHEVRFVNDSGMTQTITGSAPVANQGLRHVHFESGAPRVISGQVNFSGDVVIHWASPAVTGVGATVGIGGAFIDSTIIFAPLRAGNRASSRENPGVGTFGRLYDYNGGWQVSNTILFGNTPIYAQAITTNLTVAGAASPVQDFELYGNLVVSGGSGILDVAGQGITVYGNFSTTSGGRLKMIDVADGDYLGILGSATFGGGSTSGLLLHGLLEVMGDFVQSGGSTTAFAADPGMQVDIGYVDHYPGAGGLRSSVPDGRTSSARIDDPAAALSRVQADASARRTQQLARVRGPAARPPAARSGSGKGRPERQSSRASARTQNRANAALRQVAAPRRNVAAELKADDRLARMKARREADRERLLQKHPRALSGQDVGALLRARPALRSSAALRAQRARPRTTAALGEAPTPSIVSFANPGPSASHFGNLYFAGYEFDLGSDLEVAGQLGTGHSYSHLVTSPTPRKITSHGADVRDVLFENVGWVLLDGSPVWTMDYVTFDGMSPTTDQFTIARTADELPSQCECSYYYLYNWYFFSPPSTGRYINATDTNGGPNNLELYMEDPVPGTHGGFIATAGGAVISHWQAAYVWTGLGTTDSWHDSGNWSNNSIPWYETDVVIPAGTPRNPTLDFAGGASMRNLTIGTGKVIDITCDYFEVYGDLVAPVGALSIMDGECGDPVQLYGNYYTPTNTVVGNFEAVYVGGNYRISGPGNQLIVSSDLSIEGNLNVNGGRLDIGGVGGTGPGSLSTYYYGTLTMQNAADQVFVGTGGAWFDGGSTTGLLTAGTFTLVSSASDYSCLHAIYPYSAHDTFAPSGTHKVVFTGPAAYPASVEFAYPAESFLNNAEIAPGSGMEVASDVVVKGTLGRGVGSGTTVITSPGMSLLTVSGLSFSSAFGTTMDNTRLWFVDGTSNATFNGVVWTGFTGLSTASIFEVTRAAGPLTFTGHNFGGVGFTPSASEHLLKNSGAAAVTMSGATPSPGVFGTHWIGAGVTWP